MKDFHKLAKQNLQGRQVKIIGLGGIGSPVSLYLSKFLYSLNSDAQVFLIDGDEFELSNLERVAFSEYGEKALVKERELAGIFGERVAYRALPTFVTHENIHQLLSERDIILLCVDNHASRRLVSEFCEGLNDVLLISGGNDGIEDEKTGTFGNVQVFWREEGISTTNSLTQFHPEIREPNDRAPGEGSEESCAVLAKAVPQLALTNLAVASEMLNALMAWSLDRLNYEEVYLDILDCKRVPISRKVAG